jgi:hypothetical protein
MSIEEFVWNPDMMKLDPDGYRVFEGWRGFISHDKCIQGALPRYLFTDEVNRGIDRVKERLVPMSAGTFHDAMSERLSASMFPQRGSCFGAHQLMTAYSELPLVYREGFCFKFSPCWNLPRNHNYQQKLNPENGKIEDWIDPKMAPTYSLSFFYHGWCWSESTGEIVDITGGPHSGLSDGFVIPMIWKNYGTNAKKSRKILKGWWGENWNKQRQIVKQTVKKHVKYQHATGDYDSFDIDIPKVQLRRLQAWMPMHELGYSRNAFYRGLFRVMPKLKMHPNVLAAVGMPQDMIARYDADDVFNHARVLVSIFWNGGRHARLRTPENWTDMMLNYREPTRPLQFSEDIFRKALAA